ncbi:MAG: phospho-N-acetylmuramoyl-pentapeptide-transferase [Erysipelothrix sp.]|nr:phospho-N-acetylmuramoyl-pentapeptide-transferase [Erysipelothrix sp.]
MELKMNLMIFLASLVISLGLYPTFIKFMGRFQLNQQVSEYALEQFKAKKQTPTMGGLIFLCVPLVVLAIFNLRAYLHIPTLLVIASFVSFGLIGLYDDYLIIVKKDNIGFTTLKKFITEVVLAILFGVLWYNYNDGIVGLAIPFTTMFISIGWLYLLVIIFMLSGVSNAVNLTDGMDGLAGGTVLIALVPYIFMALRLENSNLANFLFAVIGSLLAYLVYNTKPAKVIMGDVGSLSLGALLAATAIVLNQELSLVIIGLIFVLETLSVIIQIGSVKLRGKRVFPYTPIHYSFTIWGMKEKHVVYMFYAVGLFLAIIGIAIGFTL